MMKIKWINENPGASRDEQGYWRSEDGRFYTAPKYRSTVNPSHFEVVDTKTKERVTYDRVRDCKGWAQNRVEVDTAK